ncbi:peroxidase [Alphaproteobacteria bacterium GH1-50]|uniref:Peroxidase n=2 Tax=Kangsaoukella pontilimi TaxID=2691042 RepID=A0A7C9IHX5_9RHOB|nr:peroxidase [Kangsaoukella pontilimi]
MSKWLPTLITKSPEEGYDLALKRSGMSIKLSQPDAGLREVSRTTGTGRRASGDGWMVATRAAPDGDGPDCVVSRRRPVHPGGPSW